MQVAKRRLVTMVVVGGLFAVLSAAHADPEKVEARRSADVFAFPGEQSRVIARVRAGKEMDVLQRKNRWIKVRVNGRTGWITQTNVQTVELREAPERTKRARPFVEGRSTSRGSRAKAPKDRVGGDATEEGFLDEEEDTRDTRSERERKKAAAKRKKAQAAEVEDEDDGDDEDADEDEGDDEAEESSDDGDDEAEEASADDEASGDDEAAGEDEEEAKEDEREFVTVRVAKATIYEDADSDSDKVERASEGSKLYVIERDGKWLKVETESGDTGWVMASKVEDGGSPGDYRYPKLSKRGAVGLGYAALGQAFRSNGTDPRSNYDISSGVAVFALGGEVLYDYSKKLLLGGDLGYRFGYASPGIRYTDPDTNDSVSIGFKSHTLDLAGLAGYKLGGARGMTAFGRLGYHYERFGVNNVEDFTKNLARLPSEILSGPVLGAIFDVPRLTQKFAARARLDMIPILGARKQTVGLEDGASSKTFAAWFNLAGQYDWKSGFNITAAYEYGYSKTTFSGSAAGSMRPHQAEGTASTSAQRTDGTHLFMLGVNRAF
jgi:SH3-like domain-containing protein